MPFKDGPDSVDITQDALIQLLEGYAASKQLRTEEEVRERLKELNKNMKTAGVEWQKDYIRGGLIQLKWFLKE